MERGTTLVDHLSNCTMVQLPPPLSSDLCPDSKGWCEGLPLGITALAREVTASSTLFMQQFRGRPEWGCFPLHAVIQQQHAPQGWHLYLVYPRPNPSQFERSLPVPIAITATAGRVLRACCWLRFDGSRRRTTPSEVTWLGDTIKLPVSCAGTAGASAPTCDGAALVEVVVDVLVSLTPMTGGDADMAAASLSSPSRLLAFFSADVSSSDPSVRLVEPPLGGSTTLLSSADSRLLVSSTGDSLEISRTFSSCCVAAALLVGG